jgi:2-polyprenyl-3-methyl-5-hydroxy-6-metoxy-1,4-benzoquinol methylase
VTVRMPPVAEALPLGEKPAGYYGQERASLIRELPRPLGRVLDVGCGEGGANGPLRASGATQITGVELQPGPAAKAADVYERVEVGDAAEALMRISDEFDTILCYDVLEHLVDPAVVLTRLRELVAADGRLHVSTPNARHWSLAGDLIVRGTFGYSEFGHRDATHLRWFTRKDLRHLLAQTGWAVERSTSSMTHRLHELRVKVPSGVLNGLAGEFFGRVWYVLARPAS